MQSKVASLMRMNRRRLDGREGCAGHPMTAEHHVKPRDIANSILVARDRAVLLDIELAELYGVTTAALNQAVKRNLERFPADFAFRLTVRETIELGRLSDKAVALKYRNVRNPPVAFTEHGAIMLAMVLRSARAIQMSVHVVRAFAHLRSAARANEQLMKQMQQLEERVGKHDADIAAIFVAMRELVRPTKTPSRGIGFLADIK
jgi:phage regulator Rha-like protein